MKTSASDLLRLIFVADPRLSPAGDVAVATVTTIVPADDGEPPRYRTRLHRFDVDSGRHRELTLGAGRDTHPRFDPDGTRVAFLRADRDERPQLHLLPLDGGEARCLTSREAGVSAFAWHPRGRALALLSPARKAVPQEDGAPLRVTRSRHQAEGEGLLAEVAHQVLVLEVEEASPHPAAAAGAPRVLAEFPFGASQLVYADDGTLFVLAATSDREHAELRGNILAVPPDGSPPRPLLSRAMQIASFAVDSAAGRIGFLAPIDAARASAPAALWTVSVEGGDAMRIDTEDDLAPSVAGDSRFGDLPATPVPWDDGWLVTRNVHGASNLCHVARGGEVLPLGSGDRAVTAFDGQGGRIVFTAERPDRPGELFLRQPDGAETRLSHFNDDLADACGFRMPTAPVTVEGEEVDLAYWRLEPSEPRDDRAIVAQVHGGPATNYGYGFLFEFQLLASRGYTVVYGNPRGGSSFGFPFASAIQGRYGTVDADDVLAMVEHAAAAHDDPAAPVHLTGGSYGGFMTNWLVARTQRFRSAVTQRSICNFLSFYGTSDIGPWFTEREIGGRPWKDFDALWRQSPLRYASDVETPLLILHAENDRRCPIEQAEQLYAALRRVGRAPTELVRFPGEGHELSRSGRPDRRIARLEAIVDWFERHP